MKKIYGLALVLALLLTACAPAGNTPSPASSQSPPTQSPPPGPLVYTDASQLTPYEKPERPQAKFTRRYAAFTDTLIPADDYGVLIPFPGVNAAQYEENGWGMWDYQLYGLVTLDGEVVVDPVFSSASRPRRWDELAQTSVELDCLLLQKVVLDENGEPQSVAAVCATDGSWCTGFDYSYDWELLMDGGDGGLLPLRKGGSAIVFLDPHTGEELRTVDLSNLLERWPDVFWSLGYYIRHDTRYAIFSDEKNHYLFDADAGEFSNLEELLGCEIESPYTAAFSDGLCPVKTASGYGYIDGQGHWVTDPVYEEAWNFQNGRAIVRDEQAGNRYTVLDTKGNTLYTFPEGAENVRFDGDFLCYEQYDGNVTRKYFLDESFTPLSLPSDFTKAQVQGDWFVQELPDPSPTVPGGCAFWNVKTGSRWDFPGLDWYYSIERNYTLLRNHGDFYDYTLADLSTGEAKALGRWDYVRFDFDVLTGKQYLLLWGLDGAGDEWQTLSGDTLYRMDEYSRSDLYGGKLFTQADSAVTITDLKSGELIFSWPLAPSMDD